MLRESRNAIKIEAKSGRISQVPIDPTETIWDGDMVMWNGTSHVATKLTAAADGATFMGVSNTQNPQTSAGTLTDDFQKSFINVVQLGLVTMIAGAAETLMAFQALEMITDAQHVKSSTTPGRVVGIVDCGWAGSGGKTVAIGDEIKMWLKVSALLSAFGGRESPDIS